MKPLDFSLLEVESPSDQKKELLFHVASSPTNGRLVVVTGGMEVDLKQGDHFSWEDVERQRILFLHDKEKSR